MVTVSPPPALVPLLALAGAALAAFAALGAGLDAPGRALVSVGAVLLLGGAALAASSRPVLAVDGARLEIRLGWRRYRLDWSQVHQVRVDPRRRSRSLEIDLGESLIVIPAFLLGAQRPEDVALAIEAQRPGGSRGADT